MPRVPGWREFLPAHRLARWGISAWSIIGILLLGATALWALLQVRDVFPPLVLALVTIYLLNPVVTTLERRGVPRIAGSCLTYVVFISAVVVAFMLLVPVVVNQGKDFVQDFPSTAQRIGDLGDRVTNDLESRLGRRLDLGEWLGNRSDLIAQGIDRAGSILRGAVHTVVLLVLGPILAFYLLVDLPRLRRATMSLVPPDRRPEVVEVASAVGRAMGGFFRGQLLVALIVGILSSVAMRIIGIPYWIVVGMLAGFFNMIPLIGPYIGAIPGILIAGAFMAPINMLWVAIAMTAVQQIDNHFISPNVMRWTVRLHPVTVMLSLIVGATLAGIFGMLLAVPMVASGKVIASHFWRTRVPWGEDVFATPRPARPAPPAPPPPTEPAVHDEPAPAPPRPA